MPCKTIQGKLYYLMPLCGLVCDFFGALGNQCAEESQFHGCASRIASFQQEIGAYLFAQRPKTPKKRTCAEMHWAWDFSLTARDVERCGHWAGRRASNKPHWALIWINIEKKVFTIDRDDDSTQQRRIWTRIKWHRVWFLPCCRCAAFISYLSLSSHFKTHSPCGRIGCKETFLNWRCTVLLREI